MSGFSAWLNDIEGISAQQALKTGLPTKRVESWKYVPTRSLTRTGGDQRLHKRLSDLR